MAQSTEITPYLLGYIFFLNYFVHLNLLGYLYYDETYDSYTISFSVFVVPRTIVQILHNRQGTFQQSDQQIYQDRNGMIWIATEDGLNRYDGAKFITYKHDPETSTPSAITTYECCTRTAKDGCS